jgi:hypothetical protein
MKRPLPFLFFVIAALLLLSACGSRASGVSPAPAATEAPMMEEPMMEAAAATLAPVMEKSAYSIVGMPTVSVSPDGQADVNASDAANPSLGRMIIKNSDMRLQVEDTDVAIDRTTQMVGDLGGYIVSSRSWYQAYDKYNLKYATLTLGMPVDQFEHALNRLRGFSVTVLDETASGEDVTDQYVDLQSQITNLEATRDRIKSFLDEAKTVDEALRVNQQLSEIEGQIEQIKGRMNYLKDRSAYSTITVNFEPVLPEIVSTPVPTPTPQVWDPGKTFGKASKSLTTAYQGITDFLIWVFVVVVPILLPPLLILWGLLKWLTRKPAQPK